MAAGAGEEVAMGEEGAPRAEVVGDPAEANSSEGATAVLASSPA